MTEVYKKVEFRGDTREVVREWPDDVRRTAGNEIFRVQTGKEPHDWKPFPDVGPGIREIRIREESGAFRVMYQATVGRCSLCIARLPEEDTEDRESGC